jgi:hypothetical protein
MRSEKDLRYASPNGTAGGEEEELLQVAGHVWKRSQLTLDTASSIT